MNKKIVEAVVTIITAYAVYRLSPEGRDATSVEALLLHTTARIARRVAYTAGMIGLRAEAGYQERIRA